MTYIEIPVRPHIREWFTREYGSEPQATMRNLLGGILRNAAMGVHLHAREIKKPGSELIRVKVSPNMARYTKDENAIREAGYLLEEVFTTSAVSFITAMLLTGSKTYGAINAFYEHYGLHQDILDREALRAIWRDHTERRDALNLPRPQPLQAMARV